MFLVIYTTFYKKVKGFLVTYITAEFLLLEFSVVYARARERNQRKSI